MLPLRGVWWAVMLECHSAPADMQTREDCHRWSPRAQLRMLQFSIAQLELPAPWGTLQPSGSRSGLRETLSGPNGQVGRWGRQVHPPVPPLQGAALSCILHLFQPPGKPCCGRWPRRRALGMFSQLEVSATESKQHFVMPG